MPPISSVKTAEDDASSVPCLNGAHAARNKRKLGDHRPRAKRNRSLPLPAQSQRGLFTDRAKEGEEEEVGFIMARQETNLSQLQCWPCCRRQGRQAGRKEGRGQCSQSDCCSNATRSKQAAGQPSCPWGPGASSSKLETVTFPPSALDG